MKLSTKGANFIKQHEGFKDIYYDLGDGGLTVGFGNYMTHSEAAKKGIKKGDRVSTSQANEMFDKSVATFVNGVNRQVEQYGFKLNQNQFDALVSYAYNRGLGNNNGTNGLRQLLKNSDSVFDISKNLLVYWGTAVKFKKGLMNRRKAEKKLFDTKAPSTSNIDKLAKEVIAGKHGTGSQREKSLGKDYNAVQSRVNELSKKRPNKPKTINQLAKEVIAGKHGTGRDRMRSLGTNYAKVQQEVTKLMRK